MEFTRSAGLEIQFAPASDANGDGSLAEGGQGVEGVEGVEDSDDVELRPPQAVDPLANVATPAEQLLYLHLQRFAFCLDRHEVRFPLGGREPLAVEERDARIRRISDEIAALDVYIATRFGQDDLPANRLRRRFELESSTIHLIVAAAAPALDLTLARRIFAYCGRGQPEVGFLVEVLAASFDEERRLLAALRPTAPAIRWRLIRLGASRDWAPETPILHQLAVVPGRVIEWLRGEVGFDVDRFERTAVVRQGRRDARGAAAGTATGAAAGAAAGAAIDAAQPALFVDDGGRRAPVVVTGPALAGKATLIVAAAAARGLDVIDVDLASVAEAAHPPDLVCDLGREAMMRGAVLLLRHADVVVEHHPELRRAVMSLLDSGALWAAVTVRGEWDEPVRRIAGTERVRVDMPSQAQQLVLWQRALPASVACAEEVSLPQIVERYRLTPGDILEAGSAARRSADRRGHGEPVTPEDLVSAVRERLRHRLGDVAELISTTLIWHDIVLPPLVMDGVSELISTINNQHQVMERWGFNRKVAYGRAVSALFSGPPGTGKTMVASLIAKELGLELFRVDLARIVSKYVGETEKNLGRAFDEAENSQAVLLFDEADALFAKRTDVKSSNDRYANLEVNYLLQRLESFEGIVLLTTNNASSIDDAFRRRLRFRIEFDTPDVAERRLLWHAMFPLDAPLADDVDFDQLAEQFEMSGGYIKNAAVRAAFLAAAAGPKLITHALVMRAAQLEWREMGRLGKG
jgi:hypothetical protein